MFHESQSLGRGRRTKRVSPWRDESSDEVSCSWYVLVYQLGSKYVGTEQPINKSVCTLEIQALAFAAVLCAAAGTWV